MPTVIQEVLYCTKQGVPFVMKASLPVVVQQSMAYPHRPEQAGNDARGMGKHPPFLYPKQATLFLGNGEGSLLFTSGETLHSPHVLLHDAATRTLPFAGTVLAASSPTSTVR